MSPSPAAAVLLTVVQATQADRHHAASLNAACQSAHHYGLLTHTPYKGADLSTVCASVHLHLCQ